MAQTFYWLGGVGTKLSAVATSLGLEGTHYYIDCSNSETSLVTGTKGKRVTINTTGQAMGGSGGNRATNSDAIMRDVPATVSTDMPPSDINFLCFSGSGASGATIAYALAKEIIAQGKSLVLFITLDTSSLTWAKNAYKCFASLQNLAEEYNVGIQFFGYDTSKHNRYLDSDRGTVRDMQYVSTMLSQDVVGLDDADRKHFLNPLLMAENTTAAGIYGAEMIAGATYKDGGMVITSLTLTKPGDKSPVIGADSPFTGEIGDTQKALLQKDQSYISIIVTIDLLSAYMNKLDENIGKLEKLAAARRQRNTPKFGGNGGGFIA